MKVVYQNTLMSVFHYQIKCLISENEEDIIIGL